MADTSDTVNNYGSLILDSGAVIRNQGPEALSKLLLTASIVYTTPSVIAEIRDNQSRNTLSDALEIVAGIEGKARELKVRTPTAESLSVVCTFARKTGDYRSLSRTDIEVLALQYEIDVQECGGSNEHLRLNKFDDMKTKLYEKNIDSVDVKGKNDIDSAISEKREIISEEKDVDHSISGCDAEVSKEQSNDENKKTTTTLTNSTPKSWATLLGGSENVEITSTAVGKENVQVMFGKMNLLNGEEELSSLGGQFDDAEDDKDVLNQESHNDAQVGTAQRLETEFPLLKTDSEFETSPTNPQQSVSTNVKSVTDSKVREEKKKEALKPRLTKDGRYYNSFQNSKYKHLLTADGIGKDLKSEEEIQHERELKKIAFIQNIEAKKAHELDDTDPEWKSKSRIINGSDVIGQSNEVEDDGKGWVNMSNFRSGEASLGFGLNRKAKKVHEESESLELSDICRAACATTDFAMQNVILQMGMKLITVEGRVVRRLKQWVTRCGACFTIFSNDESRSFCSRCGSDMLQRIAASVDGKTGKYILHLSKKKQKNVNKRGTKFALPSPWKGNRFEGDLLLREDQLMMGAWHQKMKKGNKELQSIFGSDITSGVGLADITKRDDVKVGFGRRNPNATKFGRERRGKKKKNPQQMACGLRRNFH